MRGVSKDHPVGDKRAEPTLRRSLESPSRPLRGASGRGQWVSLDRLKIFLCRPLAFRFLRYIFVCDIS